MRDGGCADNMMILLVVVVVVVVDCSLLSIFVSGGTSGEKHCTVHGTLAKATHATSNNFFILVAVESISFGYYECHLSVMAQVDYGKVRYVPTWVLTHTGHRCQSVITVHRRCSKDTFWI